MMVNLRGRWEEYLTEPPAGAEALGIVHDGRGEIGALVRYKSTGLYALAKGSMICSLDPVQLKAAIVESERYALTDDKHRSRPQTSDR